MGILFVKKKITPTENLASSLSKVPILTKQESTSRNLNDIYNKKEPGKMTTLPFTFVFIWLFILFITTALKKIDSGLPVCSIIPERIYKIRYKI